MLGYRTFVNVPSCDGDLTALVMSQLHSWLRRKGYDADALVPGRTVDLSPGVEGLLLHLKGQDAETTRFHLTENNSTGRWVTDLTVHLPAGLKRPPVVWVDVQSPREMFTKTPRLAKQILDVVDAYDGTAHLTATPELVRREAVESMVDVICDPDRRGLAFIAGTEDRLPLDRWRELVAQLLADTTGLAAAYVLDADATREFSRLVGASHHVPPGAVRTYLPEADPADPEDALRHRILGTNRIVQGESSRLQRVLGWKARELSLTKPLPRWASKLGDRLEEEIDAAILAGSPLPSPRTAPPRAPAAAPNRVVAEPAVPAPATASLTDADSTVDVVDLTVGARLVAGLHDRLGIAVLDETGIDGVLELVDAGRQLASVQAAGRQRLEDLQLQLRSAKEAQAELQGLLDDESLEHAVTLQEALVAEQDASRLRLELARLNHGEVAWSIDSRSDVGAFPETFSDLMDRLEGIDHVVFTGDVDLAVDLDQHSELNTWATKAYQSLRALSDYAACKAAGEVSTDFHGYLLATPPGRAGWSPRRHARDESEDVHKNPKFWKARVFPVPESVDPSGRVLMAAHVKIAQSGLISPRLHYHDDTSGTGKIYVGYIGRHLPTQRTN